MWISKREFNLLMQELAYYRERFDAERRRNELLTDNVIQSMGMPPVSSAGVERQAKNVEETKKLYDDLSELSDEDIFAQAERELAEEEAAWRALAEKEGKTEDVAAVEKNTNG